MLKLVTILVFITPTAAWAQGRGDGCNGFFCNLTAVAILIVLVGFFLESIIISIKRRGVIKGLFGHAGVQMLLGCLAILIICAGFGIGLLALLGKV